MKNLRIVKKLLTFITCSALAVAFMTYYSDSFSSVPDVSAKTIAELQEARKENEAKIAEYEEKIKELEGNKDEEKAYQETLQNSITLIQDNITLLNEELDRLNKEVTDTESRIEELNNSIAEQQEQVDANLELFKERLCAMYITGNNSLASAILGATDFYDMLSRMEMVNSIAAHDEELVNKILGEIEALEDSKYTLQSEKLTLEMKLEEQEKKKAEKQTEIDELSVLVQKTQAEIDRIAREQEELEKSKDELEAENAAFKQQEADIQAAIAEAARKAAEEEALRQQQQQQQNNNTGGSLPEYIAPNSGASGFMWPTPGNYYVTSEYGWRWGRLHAGIDIGDAGIGGDPVVASKAGTVAYVYSGCTHNYPKTYLCCGGGYGNYIIIQHDSTYSTLYAHLTYVNVSVGEYVAQGQTIGAAGCTGHSTGDHLHFEVYVNGVTQNPRNFVSP